jgi:soluble P-type ATPase
MAWKGYKMFEKLIAQLEELEDMQVSVGISTDKKGYLLFVLKNPFHCPSKRGFIFFFHIRFTPSVKA